MERLEDLVLLNWDLLVAICLSLFRKTPAKAPCPQRASASGDIPWVPEPPFAEVIDSLQSRQVLQRSKHETITDKKLA